MYKIGDKLYCIKNYKNDLTINKTYTIIDVYNLVSANDCFIIYSDNGELNYFSNYYVCNKTSEYFILLKEMRKQKLEKLKEYAENR